MEWTKPLFSKPQPILYWVFGIPLAFGVFFVVLPISCACVNVWLIDDSYDPNMDVFTREIAATKIHSATRRWRHAGDRSVAFPASAKNYWFYEGGNFGGSIIYGMFDCNNREDCLEAVESLSGLRLDELRVWEPSRYAVVMEGLDFYLKRGIGSKRLKSNPWDVRGIKNGLVHEWIQGDHRTMVYYAIDLDHNRVYYHYESGGFPDTEYRAKSADIERQATAR